MKTSPDFISAAKWLAAVSISLWAHFPLAVQMLVIFMGFDYFTGLLAAVVQRKVSSSIGWNGLMRKIAMLLAVLFIHLLDGKVLPSIGIMELGLEKIFAIYLTFNEVISSVENLNKSGVRFPRPIVAALVKLKDLVPQAATQDEIDALSTRVVTETTSIKKEPGGAVTTTAQKTEVVVPPQPAPEKGTS